MERQWIYLVVGVTGEHADRQEWKVAAYYDVETASLHCEKVKEIVKGSGQLSYEEARNLKNDFDPEMKVDCHTGTDYFVEVVGLYRHPDEFLDLNPIKESK